MNDSPAPINSTTASRLELLIERMRTATPLLSTSC